MKKGINAVVVLIIFMLSTLPVILTDTVSASDVWLGIDGSYIDSYCGRSDANLDLEYALNGTQWWQHDTNHTHYFILDFGKPYTIKKVRGRSETARDPTDISIWISMNKTSWGTAVASNISTWQDTASWVEIDNTDKEGRFIRVAINNTEDVSHKLYFGTIPFYPIFDVYGDSSYNEPDEPTNFQADSWNKTAINLTWTKGTGANETVIIRKTGSYPSSVTDGTEVYNDTGLSYNDTGLNPGIAYYYKSWSYYEWVDPEFYLFSNNSVSAFNTTDINNLTQFDNESVTPTSGFESETNFNFTVTFWDNDDIGLGVYCYVYLGVWNINESMSYLSGDNSTGANYSYLSSTFPTSGTYYYYFVSYDSWGWNQSDTNSFVVGINTSFELNFPVFLEVGQYLMSRGTMKNQTGHPLDQVWVYTKILDSTDWSTVLLSDYEYYVTDGDYNYIFSTSTMLPGVYYININYTYTGTNFSTNWTLYLSDFSGPGHIATNAYFTFYNNDGVGIDALSFKVYVDDSVPLDSTDRIYGNTYSNTYTGQTLYYRIDDYFDNQVYPTTGTYDSVTISEINKFIDVPIDWHDLAVKNLNETIMFFSLKNGSKYYNITLFPGDSIHINVLAGDYDITKMFYSGYNGSWLSTETDSVSITGDAFYISTGYNAMVHISWYNTNEGLGLPDETLKLYFDGNRSTSMSYPTYINNTVNVTVKDYYNTTLYQNDFNITTSRTFLDLGLTFHSYLFGNKNDDYYMVSLLKQGGSRWWERGIVPYGEREFLIPSGSYMMRIYDKDDTEIYNTSAYDSITNSHVYVIHGTNLSLIISGQSTITGQLLELQTELADAIRPAIVKELYNVPHVYCLLKREGSILGTEKICPYQIMEATTRNETTINSSTIFYPLLPDNSSSSVTILTKKDTMYLSGNSSVNWVNISYSSSYTNYSYIPTKIDLFGEDVTIDTNSNLSILRETTFQKQSKFNWTKYTYTNRYTSTNDYTNDLSTTLYEIYLITQFANDTLPNYNTVTVYDVTNGEYITSGENFFCSADGVHMYLDSLSANDDRSFTFTYYAQESVQASSNAVDVVNEYDMEKIDDTVYYHFEINWKNEKTYSFVGTLDIQLNFDTYPYTISKRSIKVYDNQQSRWLDRDEFVYSDGSIEISQDALGGVDSGHSRVFDIYFQYVDETVEETTSDEEGYFFSSEVYGPIQYIHLILLFLVGLGIAFAKADWKKYTPMLYILSFIGFILVIMYYGGA